MPRRVAVYARISVSQDSSVSLARQIKAAQQYAAAREWEVVGIFQDDGISATHTKPEDRTGWRALLDSPARFDGVLVWKIDRLARRVLDFLHADEALQTRGAGIVAVDDPIDMTTPQGRAFATLLAVFGEMEGEAIRARVKAARDHLIRQGRVVGGTIPYGWQSIKNPDGPGYVLAHDPARIDDVRKMAGRVLRGDSVYSTMQWLNDRNVPPPAWPGVPFVIKPWVYSTVERLLRNPVLAGMTSYNPGQTGKARGTEVLRDRDGLPVVDETIAILRPGEWRRLVALLDDRETPQARPRASKEGTSPLLAGLAVCGHCEGPMHRGTTSGRPSLSCPKCHQTISRTQLERHLIHRLLAERGTVPITEWSEIGEDTADLTEIEHAIISTTGAMAEDGADVASLVERLESLKEMRAGVRSGPTIRTWSSTGQTVEHAWEAAVDDLTRREVMAGQIQRLAIVRGRVGRSLDPARVVLDWQAVPPLTTPDGVRLRHSESEPGQRGRIGGLFLNIGNERTYVTTR
jgi:site-specific DNA recombinase